MRPLAPLSLCRHVYGCARASTKCVLGYQHTARLGEHAACQLSPHGVAAEAQTRQLGRVEEVHAIGDGRQIAAQAHVYGGRLRLVAHLRDGVSRHGYECGGVREFKGVAHGRHVRHLRMGECGGVEHQCHPSVIVLAYVVVVAVYVGSVVALSMEEAVLYAHRATAGGEVRGIGVGGECESVGRGDGKAAYEHVLGVETHYAHARLGMYGDTLKHRVVAAVDEYGRAEVERVQRGYACAEQTARHAIGELQAVVAEKLGLGEVVGRGEHAAGLVVPDAHTGYGHGGGELSAAVKLHGERVVAYGYDVAFGHGLAAVVDGEPLKSEVAGVDYRHRLHPSLAHERRATGHDVR